MDRIPSFHCPNQPQHNILSNKSFVCESESEMPQQQHSQSQYINGSNTAMRSGIREKIDSSVNKADAI